MMFWMLAGCGVLELRILRITIGLSPAVWASCAESVSTLAREWKSITLWFRSGGS